MTLYDFPDVFRETSDEMREWDDAFRKWELRMLRLCDSCVPMPVHLARVRARVRVRELERRGACGPRGIQGIPGTMLCDRCGEVRT